MSRITLLLLLVSLSFSISFGQKAKDGKTAFSSKQYALAIPMLSTEYAKAKTRLEKGKIAFSIGESARILGREALALEWYQKAYDDQYGVDALRELAYTYKRLEKYQEAKETFKNLGIEIGSPYEYRREINACDIAIGWKKIVTPEYQITPAPFNTSLAEYAPAFYRDNELVFSSDRGTSTGEAVYGWTGNRFSDFFVYNPQNQTLRNMGVPFNTPANEGTISFTADFTHAYFIRCSGNKKEDAFCRIMESTFQDNHWNTPVALPFQDPQLNYGHPCISADGNTLYFACQHPDGWGGFDIYTAKKEGDEWSTPTPLSRTINTPGNEQFPFLDADTLYFSSDFHPGMGGLDIFRTYRMRNGDWAPVFNLKPPINSGGDDFAFAVSPFFTPTDEHLQMGYFSSNRPGSTGNDDLYQFDRKVVPPDTQPNPLSNQMEKKPAKLLLEVFVLEKIFADPANPNSKVLGRKPLPNATLEIVAGSLRQTATTDAAGRFELILDSNTSYQFLASVPGYLTNLGRFNSQGLNPGTEDQVFELEIVLDKIFLNQEITLDNIYYDYDKWDIREDAKPTLNLLAENLRLNPKIRIQLASHTDCRGNETYNLELSRRRAESAVAYLIQSGIDPARLQARGFGETQPAVDCLCSKCTEEQHQTNRRTTFSILEL